MKQRLADLRNKLEKWKSHNEVHAKPADVMLYEFLSELLKLGEGVDEQESVAEDLENGKMSDDSALAKATEISENEINASFDVADDDSADTGGSNPPVDKGRG